MRATSILIVIAFSFFASAGSANKTAEKTTNTKSKPLKILILGDSLTEGYGVSKSDSFPQQLELLLQEKFPYRKSEVINAGSSGSTSASAAPRLKWLSKNSPDILILALGANDGLRGFKVDATQKNLQKAIDLAREKKITVILAGMKIPLNYGPKYRADFEKMYADLAKTNQLVLIPFLLKDVGGRPDLNLPDGIHPNEEGHKIIAKTILPYLEKYY